MTAVTFKQSYFLLLREEIPVVVYKAKLVLAESLMFSFAYWVIFFFTNGE